MIKPELSHRLIPFTGSPDELLQRLKSVAKWLAVAALPPFPATQTLLFVSKVSDNRRSENTQFVRRSLSWFKDNDFYDKIQSIRTSPDWYNQVGWLKESTQARLDNYNPLVMSKVFLLNDAKIMDQFNSEYLFWIGMLVSAKTPRDIVNKLNQSTLKALQDNEVKERLAGLGAEAMPMSPEQFDQLIKDELISNAAVIKAAGIKSE